MIDISPSEYKFDDFDFNRFQNEIGTILPEDYKTFLQNKLLKGILQQESLQETA